jgi:hypothetical protein
MPDPQEKVRAGHGADAPGILYFHRWEVLVIP